MSFYPNNDLDISKKAKQLNQIYMNKETESKILDNILAYEKKAGKSQVHSRKIKLGLGLAFACAAIYFMLSGTGANVFLYLKDSTKLPTADELNEDQTPVEITEIPDSIGEKHDLVFRTIGNDVLEEGAVPHEYVLHRVVEIERYKHFDYLKFSVVEDLDGFFHIYLEQGEQSYYLGEFGSSLTMDSDSFTIELKERPEDIGYYLDVSGGGGAIVENRKLVFYDEQNRQWLSCYFTNITEEVLELSGTSYLVATSRGSILSFVTILRWNGTEFEYADVAKALRLDYASLKPALGRTWIEAGNAEEQNYYVYNNNSLIKVNESQLKAIQLFETLDLSASKEIIIEQYGSNYTEKIGHKNNDIVWSYDLGVREGYSPLVMEDTIDLNGILHDDILLTFSVAWDDAGEQITRFAITYKESDHTLIAYLVTLDGLEKFDILNLQR